MRMLHCTVPVGLAAVLAVAGCQQMNHAESGALLGTGLGATTGAVIGSGSGHAGGGALIGAAAGALAGGLAGNAVDAREERDAAVAHAQYAQAQSHAAARALSSSEVVDMSRNGVSDDVIINAIQTRGCHFEGDPQSIIYMKQQGASDRVIAAMQNASSHAAPAVVTPPTVVYGAPPPPAPPAVVIYGGPRYGPRPWGPPPYGPYYGPRPYRRYWW